MHGMNQHESVSLKRTPLFPLYQDVAKLVPFGGWEMPVQFTSIMKEHEAVRRAVGLFDVSHMGEVLIRGKDAQAFLNYLLTNDVQKLKPGMAQYTLMLSEDGGTIDDLLLYQVGNDEYMLVTNAANTDGDVAWMEKVARTSFSGADVMIEDISTKVALLALQGPHAYALVKALFDDDPTLVTTLKPFRFLQNVTLAGYPIYILSRTGYTGEDGFELYMAPEEAQKLWPDLLEKGLSYGLLPAGLGARDTLRLEAALPLYGQELSPSIDPLTAGLKPFVKMQKQKPFLGQEALEKKMQHQTQTLVGIQMVERGIPRSGYEVYDEAGRSIGHITSGTQSPTLGVGIALSLIDRAQSTPGTQVWIDIRGKKTLAQVVALPFYKRPKNYPS